MENIDNKLAVLLEQDIKEYLVKNEEAIKESVTFKKKINKINSFISKYETVLFALGTTLVASGITIFNEFLSFQKVVTNLEMTINNDIYVKDFTEKAIELSKIYGTDLLDTIEGIILYSKKTSDINTTNLFMEYSAKVAAVTNSKVSTVVDLGTSIWVSFQKEFTNYEDMWDNVLGLLNNSNISIEDLNNGVKTILPLIAKAGLTFKDFSRITSILSLNLDKEKITSSLQQIFSLLIDNKLEINNKKISATDFNSENLLNTINQLKNTNFESLKTEGVTLRQTSLVANLTVDEELLNNKLKNLENVTGTLNDNFKKISNSVNYLLNINKAYFEDIKRLMGESLNPLFQNILNSFKSSEKFISDLFKNNKDFFKSFFTNFILITGTSLIFSKILTSFIGLFDLVSSISAINISNIFSFLVTNNPTALIVTFLAALIGFISYFFIDDIYIWFQSLYVGLLEVLETSVIFLTTISNTLLTLIDKIPNSLIEGMASFLGVVDLGKALTSFKDSVVANMQEFNKNLVTKLQAMVYENKQKLIQAVYKKNNSAFATVAKIKNIYDENINNLYTTTEESINNYYSFEEVANTNVNDYVSEVADYAGEATTNLIEDAGLSMENMGDSVYNSISTKTGTGGNWEEAHYYKESYIPFLWPTEPGDIINWLTGGPWGRWTPGVEHPYGLVPIMAETTKNGVILQAFRDYWGDIPIIESSYQQGNYSGISEAGFYNLHKGETITSGNSYMELITTFDLNKAIEIKNKKKNSILNIIDIKHLNMGVINN